MTEPKIYFHTSIETIISDGGIYFLFSTNINASQHYADHGACNYLVLNNIKVKIRFTRSSVNVVESIT